MEIMVNEKKEKLTYDTGNKIAKLNALSFFFLIIHINFFSAEKFRCK